MIATRLGTSISRRTLIGALATEIVLSPADPAVSTGAEVKAVVFDAFPIFDPRVITTLSRSYFPKDGEILANLWSSKLFSYTWLCAAAGHYEPFETLADKALRYAAEALQISVPAVRRALLVCAYSQLDLWPDVKPALQKLRNAGLRLGFLSNLSESTLMANMRNRNVAIQFEHALSTDRVQQFKPAPGAYRMAIDAFGLPKEEIAFVAFGRWDAAGASWFGYRTAWVNRLGVPDERVGPRPVIVSRGIDGALALAGLV